MNATLIWAPLAIENAPCPRCGAQIGDTCSFTPDEEASIRAQRPPHDTPIDPAVWTRTNLTETCHVARRLLWTNTSNNAAAVEVERCHAALDSIYETLVYLEPTLTLEQILLLPIDRCKWWKSPEWENRYAYRQSDVGRAAHHSSLCARVERLRAKFPDARIPDPTEDDE